MGWTVVVVAQLSTLAPTAAIASIGGNRVALQDEQALFGNQAGLAWIEDKSIHLGAQSIFLLEDARFLNAGFALPTSSGTFGLSLSSLHFASLDHQRIGLGYGRKLAENLSIGGQVNTWIYQIDEYGSTTTLSFELGAQYEILKGLIAGFHVESPVQVALSEEEDLPTILTAGFAYTPSNKLGLFAQAQKGLDTELTMAFGIDYALAQAMRLRLGLDTQAETFTFGISYQIKELLRLDLASSYHSVLGFSPNFGATIRL